MQWPPTSPGVNGRKFHLVRGGLEHVERGDVELGEDLGDLVHEGDVDVALGVLDDLGRLGDPDRFRPEHAAGGDPAVNGGDALGHLGILARDHLDDLFDGMLAVARIDPLGRVSEEEVAAALQPRHALDQRPAHLLGDARIDRAFEDDHRRPGGIDQPGDRLGRLQQRREVRTIRGVDRSRHGDDIDVGAARRRGLRGRGQRRAGQPVGSDLAGPVVATAELLDPRRSRCRSRSSGNDRQARPPAAGRHSRGR